MVDFSILEVATISNAPVKLNFVDYINCPVCDFEIDVKDEEVDNDSTICCENCEHTIKFDIVKV